MPPVSGSWKTGSGLLDDFDFTIEEAYFGVNEKFGDSTLLTLRGIAEQEVDGEMQVVDEEHTLLYSCGEGWEAANGGRSAVHAAGKTIFINSTNMGRLIDAIVGLGDEAVEELASRGDTFEADTWEGLKFHIERKKFSYTSRDTKERVEYEVPLPVDYQGVVEVEEAPKKAAPKAKPATGAAKKPTPKAAKVEPEVEEEEAAAPKKPTPRKKSNAALRKAIIATGAEYDFEGHADFVAFIFDPEQFDQAVELQADEELSAEALDDDSKLWAEVLAAE